MSSGGGGGGGDTTSTVYQNSLPQYAQPYFEDLMGKSAAAVEKPYQAYTGQTVAGQNATQQSALAGYQNPTAGTNYMTQAANNANNLSNFNYSPTNVNASNVTAGTTNTGTFDNAAAQQYMNPYTQQVIDVQKAQALRDYQQQNINNNSNLIGQGAFGGTRQAIMGAEAQRNLQSQLQGITATGLNTGYQNAQQQFNADQARQLSSQQGNVQSNLQAQLANQQVGMNAQTANQQAGLNAAGLNSQTQLNAANSLGNIGSTMGQQDLTRLGAINTIGGQQQQTQQEQLNSAYNQWLNQQNYAQNQLAWYGNILHGTNVGANTTQTSILPQTSLASQLGGLGLAGLGAATSSGG